MPEGWRSGRPRRRRRRTPAGRSATPSAASPSRTASPPPMNRSSRWPARMLANSRTESEISRAKCEIASITKMKALPKRVHVLQARRQPAGEVRKEALRADALDVVGDPDDQGERQRDRDVGGRRVDRQGRQARARRCGSRSRCWSAAAGSRCMFENQMKKNSVARNGNHLVGHARRPMLPPVMLLRVRS